MALAVKTSRSAPDIPRLSFIRAVKEKGAYGKMMTRVWSGQLFFLYISFCCQTPFVNPYAIEIFSILCRTELSIDDLNGHVNRRLASAFGSMTDKAQRLFQ